MHYFAVVQTCQETKIYPFNDRDHRVETIVNPIEPTEEICWFTKLNIEITVKPGDEYTQSEIDSNREQFRRIHKEHSINHTLKTNNHCSVSYLVADNNSVAATFHPIYYYVFALLALSLPYRWCVSINVGHTKVKILKLVYQKLEPSESTSEPSPPSEEALPLVTSAPSPHLRNQHR